MSDKAAAIWSDLYTSVFARSRHPELWEAMAKLSDAEKAQIDDDAEIILEAVLK